MKVRTLWTVGLLMLVSSIPAFAGAKLKISDTASIDLGFRVQALYLATDRDIDGDGEFESYDEFRLRRGRLRLTGVINDRVTIFMQTDVSGNDVQLIDGYVELKADEWARFFVGQNMAPANRQNLTSSGALMAADRPAMAYKSLTWGGRAVGTFATATYSDSATGLSGPAQVRDLGLTLFGSGDVGGDNVHMKYYAGVYNGISAAGTDSERTSGRLQFNFGDAEGGYYNSSTYLGKKKTIGVGVSFDQQSDIRTSATPLTDFSYWSADFFAEQPLGAGSLTFEAAYSKLDLDDANLKAQGDGFYAQAGFLIGDTKWQPWVLYEDWSSDSPDGKGSYDALRVGVTYFIAGQNANIKIGYESFNAGARIGSSSEDSIQTVLVGFYTTY